jgi:2-oxoglutarate dehydrogenase E1 component
MLNARILRINNTYVKNNNNKKIFRCLSSQPTYETKIPASSVSIRLLKLIRSFRLRGHFAASLDPLSSLNSLDPTYELLEDGTKPKHIETKLSRRLTWLPDNKKDHPDVVQLFKNYPDSLNLEPFKLECVPVDIPHNIDGELFTQDPRKFWTITELITFLKQIYCGSVGVEFLHIENIVHRDWLVGQFEGNMGIKNWSCISTKEDKMKIWKHLMETNNSAAFLNKKYPSAKVFGIEGCDSLIPGLFGLLEISNELGVEAIEIGMSHRGRMNVLHNFLGKRLRDICGYFHEVDADELGDVKYHLGTRSEVLVTNKNGDEKVMSLSLSANPSHLEAVNPVVVGKCKAKQFFVGDNAMKRVMPVLLHGDAAFSGQGIVPEMMELSDLPDYTVGGCIHVVINNQIGYTTEPRQARTSYHCTNVAKGIGAPIFHVNSDDVEAVVAVFRLAVAWRQQFGRDCVVDLVCYRRHGHNTLDDPSIYNPMTQKLIDNHPTALQIYTKKLLELGVATQQELDDLTRQNLDEYNADYVESKGFQPDPLEWLASNWQGKAIGQLIPTRPYNQTGVRTQTLLNVGRSLTTYPEDFVLHPTIVKLIASRKKMLATGQGLTMAFAESMAFGSLMSCYNHSTDQIGLRGLTEEERQIDADSWESGKGLDIPQVEHPSVHIRLSGQDCIRGTFNQRHAEIKCQESNRSYVQLNHLRGVNQATLKVANSSLSEYGVLGFEYGYSLGNEMSLTMWEAQFGDFSNVGQCIIDNFIASGESKWNNQCSLVLLLPHGYDGHGPEHSSARIERFLQLVDDDPDSIPGNDLFTKKEMDDGYEALCNDKGVVTKEAFTEAVLLYTPKLSVERMDIAIAELLSSQADKELESDPDSPIIPILSSDELNTPDLSNLSRSSNKVDDIISKDTWHALMSSWLQSNSDRRHNINIVNPSTPAQYFHCLRRQIHRYIHS